ncbi:MAG TPA: helix-turn-helix transcriptional regulator [Bacteroidia bacterium]|nr:helix-turn-helix transcriptional regulator [Bacteroidia bacterium]
MDAKEELKYLKNLSKNIKKIRQQKGLTQADCGIDERTMRRIENENYNPSYLTLVQISKAFDITIMELLNF